VYVDAVRQNDIVFAIGPAGTGKTYLAVALAVWNLTEGLVRRIILVRPAVEAGERLGFLPGDIAAKFDPFVRPLYDALYDMMESERVKQYLETGVIEIAPLAFMRGRTLNDAFVILDEGQNTTKAQMKMFLTRLGMNSKAVVTGDVTQVDLPADTQSGLIHVQKVLKNIKGIAYVFLENHDVVRHDLVQRIVRAYETHGSKGA
jgi:phosphate starvation-inducible PhoH-like protein